MQRGVDTSVFLFGRVAEVRGDARTNLEILGRLGVTVVEVADSQAWELHFSEVGDCTLIVDAIFGALDKQIRRRYGLIDLSAE